MARRRTVSLETIITLRPDFFQEKERTFLRNGEFTVSLFRYETGVEAARIANSRGEMTVLPFQGQQIWDARFDGHVLTMKSLFDEPKATREFTATYGAFLLHCGVTAMGNPGKEDTHPLHGELPNAPYQKAWITMSENESGPSISLCGEYRHTLAFECDYAFRPCVTLPAGATVISIDAEIRNMRKVPMEMMYLAHINFRPVDNGRLVYSAPCTPATVGVRTVVPADIHPAPGYEEFLRQLAADPARHNVLAPGLAFDPEAVFYLSYRGDASGWARTLMVHPDGYASYVGHQPRQLDHGLRWISRMADQDAIGILLPATAEPDGYLAEKAKGNVKALGAQEAFRLQIEAGLLAPAEAGAMEKRISEILGG
jgi:hypothetical protein